MKTIKNKIAAITLIALGFIPTIAYGDLTCLIFLAAVAIPLFFAKENWFYED